MAQVATGLAYGSGELGKMTAGLDRMRQEAGVEDEEWDVEGGDPPDAYTELSERCGEMLQKIDDMMIVDVMRRYRLDAYADLFEGSREAFEARSMAGGKVLFKDPKR